MVKLVQTEKGRKLIEIKLDIKEGLHLNQHKSNIYHLTYFVMINQIITLFFFTLC